MLKNLLSAGLVLLVVSGVSGTVSAADLVPDGGDPNAAPPVPPPMPEPGQPGSATPPPPVGSTEAKLDQSGKEDNGLGLKLVYIQADLGLGWATLGGTLPTGPWTATTGATAGKTVDYDAHRSGGGAAFGVGAGLEFITFQVGARLRGLSTGSFNLWNMGGEIALQPGAGRFWPRFGLNVGYVWAGGFKDELCVGYCSFLDISGVNVGARGGFQYFLGKNLEVGADLTADVMFLKRAAVNGQRAELAQDARGTGFQVAALGHLGLHFP
ncbi:MAG: hypothetical protein JNL79_18815 [Myxococcales bacterium]|nr:hypothetical protein [Myxococcales bacterium]